MYGMTPAKPSFIRAFLMALLMTSPAMLIGLWMLPALYLPSWFRWIIFFGWLSFGILAGQKTLQKMRGDAGPRWWANYAESVRGDAPKRRR